jgi:hypothetical protein
LVAGGWWLVANGRWLGGVVVRLKALSCCQGPGLGCAASKTNFVLIF